MNRLLPLSLALVVLAGCSSATSGTRATKDPIAVRVAPVRTERMALPVTASGVLGPKEDVALGFKVGGVIARVYVHEGESVRAGQLLAALELGEIEPGVTAARAGAEKAERDFARAQRLFGDSVATLEQLDDARSARDVARAAYDATAFNRRHAVILAPAAGVILRRSAEPGEVVSPGMPILGFGNRAHGNVLRAGLPDHEAVRVKLGDHAVVRFDALPGRTFEGTVREIAAASDPATGTYGVEVALPTALDLASGLVGTVEIRPGADTPVTLVPVEAVLEADGDAAAVYTLTPDGGHARRRPVRVAFLAGEDMAIGAGLEGVGEVITEGAGRLSDGDRVEVAR